MPLFLIAHLVHVDVYGGYVLITPLDTSVLLSQHTHCHWKYLRIILASSLTSSHGQHYLYDFTWFGSFWLHISHECSIQDYIERAKGVEALTTLPPPDHCPKCSISCTMCSHATSEKMGNQYTSGQGWGETHRDSNTSHTTTVHITQPQQITTLQLHPNNAYTIIQPFNNYTIPSLQIYISVVCISLSIL